jgi:hypothetical protein
MSSIINRLPKDLQIYISEYNVEHRKQMRNVLEQIENNKYYCFICFKPSFKHIAPVSEEWEGFCCSMECVLIHHGFY